MCCWNESEQYNCVIGIVPPKDRREQNRKTYYPLFALRITVSSLDVSNWPLLQFLISKVNACFSSMFYFNRENMKDGCDNVGEMFSSPFIKVFRHCFFIGNRNQFLLKEFTATEANEKVRLWGSWCVGNNSNKSALYAVLRKRKRPDKPRD